MLAPFLSLCFLVSVALILIYKEILAVNYSMFIKYLIASGLFTDYNIFKATVLMWAKRIISPLPLLSHYRYIWNTELIIFFVFFFSLFSTQLILSVYNYYKYGITEPIDVRLYQLYCHLLFEDGLWNACKALVPNAWYEPLSVSTELPLPENTFSGESSQNTNNIDTVNENQSSKGYNTDKTLKVESSAPKAWACPTYSWIAIISIGFGICLLDALSQC